MKFAKAMVKDPNIITLKREEESLTNIKQYYREFGHDCVGKWTIELIGSNKKYLFSLKIVTFFLTFFHVVAKNEDQKLNALFNIYGIINGQAMIFCETKKTAGYVAQKMNAAGHAVALRKSLQKSVS